MKDKSNVIITDKFRRPMDKQLDLLYSLPNGENIAQGMIKDLIEAYKTGKPIVIVIDNELFINKTKPIEQILDEMVITYKGLARPMNYKIDEEIWIEEQQSHATMLVHGDKKILKDMTADNNIIQFNEIANRALKRKDNERKR